MTQDVRVKTRNQLTKFKLITSIGRKRTFYHLAYIYSDDFGYKFLIITFRILVAVGFRYVFLKKISCIMKL